MNNPIAHFEYLGGPKLEAELFYDRVPNTVRAFASLAAAGAFNNFPVERVIPGRLIQPSYTEYDRDEGKIVIDAEYGAAPAGEYAAYLCLRGEGEIAPADFYFTPSLGASDTVVFGGVTKGFSELSERCFPGALKLRDIDEGEERWVPSKALTQKKVWIEGETLPPPEKRRMPKKPRKKTEE